MYSSLMIPDGPHKKPYNLLWGLASFRASNIPAITLWPPGAWPPERITPTFNVLETALPSADLKDTTGFP